MTECFKFQQCPCGDNCNTCALCGDRKADHPTTMRGFIVLKDFLDGDGDNSAVGFRVDQWRDGTLVPAEGGLIAEGPIVEFRLYDDDGELYYEGVFGDAEEEHDWYGDVQGGAVLNWGQWDSGCTTIKVKRDGKWIQEIG